MDSKLLAELHAQQQQLHQHQHQHQQVNGVKATQASRFQDFAGVPEEFAHSDVSRCVKPN